MSKTQNFFTDQAMRQLRSDVTQINHDMILFNEDGLTLYNAIQSAIMVNNFVAANNLGVNPEEFSYYIHYAKLVYLSNRASQWVYDYYLSLFTRLKEVNELRLVIVDHHFDRLHDSIFKPILEKLEIAFMDVHDQLFSDIRSAYYIKKYFIVSDDYAELNDIKFVRTDPDYTKNVLDPTDAMIEKHQSMLSND